MGKESIKVRSLFLQPNSSAVDVFKPSVLLTTGLRRLTPSPNVHENLLNAISIYSTFLF